ncbi:hypothetical protein VTN49DRAFT_2438 [Thermomyces lanuginosus]|uniref:uncharacterized protein n=1 Tax=Thermomyces lanuginosus TaxID=5541 RepID=UPI0037445CBC
MWFTHSVRLHFLPNMVVPLLYCEIPKGFLFTSFHRACANSFRILSLLCFSSPRTPDKSDRSWPLVLRWNAVNWQARTPTWSHRHSTFIVTTLLDITTVTGVL